LPIPTSGPELCEVLGLWWASQSAVRAPMPVTGPRVAGAFGMGAVVVSAGDGEAVAVDCPLAG